jgi:predicted ATPase
MTVTSVAIQGFRSIRSIAFPLRRLTVLLGVNGVGKTNLYRSLELLQAAAKGTLAAEIAREGGLQSVFWAGGKNLSPDGSFDPKYRSDGFRKGEKNRLQLEVRLENMGDQEDLALAYRVELGFPPPATAAFPREAHVKTESLTARQGERDVVLMERKGRAVFGRSVSGRLGEMADALLQSETALAQASGLPAVEAVRVTLSNWRFYHSFRSDPDSPLRRPSAAVTAPMLASDGSNLASVFATLRFIRAETLDLDEIIDRAFPGARLEVPAPTDFATFSMIFSETPKRPFGPHELSDGTLQFLALAGAMLAYRLPPFNCAQRARDEPPPESPPGAGRAHCTRRGTDADLGSDAFPRTR